jgi:hypothetical protein
VGDVTMIRTFFVNDRPFNEASTAPMDMDASPELLGRQTMSCEQPGGEEQIDSG